MLSHGSSSFQVTLTEGRTAAALAPFDQRNMEAKRLQDSNRCDADVWLVITDEGIVPENNVAAVGTAMVIPSEVEGPRGAIDRRSAGSLDYASLRSG